MAYKSKRAEKKIQIKWLKMCKHTKLPGNTYFEWDMQEHTKKERNKKRNVVKNAASVDQFKVEQAEVMAGKSVKISI